MQFITTNKIKDIRAMFLVRVFVFVVLMCFILSIFIFGVSATHASPNYQMNYQGKLTNASNVAVANGTYNMRFFLLTSPSIATSSALWTESLMGTNKVQVTNGLFSIMLGSTTPLTSVNFNQTLYLGVEIGGTSTPAWDGEMSPRKTLGSVPAAFEARNAGTFSGIATTSFLRSDQVDTASSLLTFTGGIISNASSTITNLTSLIATTTTLVINNSPFTSLTGSGLQNTANALTCATGNGSTFGCLASADWTLFNNKVSSTSIDTLAELETLQGGINIIQSTEIDTSAELAAILGDETGTGGGFVRATSPVLVTPTLGVAGATSVNVADITKFTATVSTNNSFIVPSSGAGSYLAYSPVPKALWHDRLAFSKAWGTPVFEVYNGSWASGTLDTGLFSQQENRSVQQIDGSTQTAARWTWNSPSASYSLPDWWIIGVTYNATATVKDFLIESSPDGVSWTTRHTSTGNTANANPVILNMTSNNGDSYIRLTITVTNGMPLKLSSIRALSSRWGDQGGGSEQESPYLWDSSQRIAFGSTSAVANGIVTIGSNTTNAANGLYFGTDTNLYRSAASQLQTDDGLTVSGLLTLGTYTASNGTTTNATTTNLKISSLRDAAGSIGLNGYVLQSNGTTAQWVATSSLGSLSTINDSNWLGDDLSVSNGGTGVSTLNVGEILIGNGTGAVTSTSTTNLRTSMGLNIGSNVQAYDADLTTWAGITPAAGVGTFLATPSSANLIAAVTNETGTGALVFATSPTFTTPNLGTPSTLVGTNISGTGASFTAGNVTTNANLTGMVTSVGNTASLGSFTSANLATALTNETGTGSSVFSASPNFTGTIGIGTTTPSSLLTLDKSAVSGAAVAGMKQYFQFTNSVASAVYYGDETYIVNAPTATSTLVAKMIRIADNSSLGNTVRGFEAQAYRGTNTSGENTGLSGFGRTFGIRGTTIGDAGNTYLPAGVFAESQGTTQGNALRAYSGSITTEDLVSLFHDTSAFTGTGLLMNFGNSGGSFTGSNAKFVDFQNGGVSKFSVTAQGTTTIGDGTTSNMAGLRIGYGGLCVDNDGSCTASTTGRITSVSSGTGNSDLAEMYFASEILHTGEIVSLQGGLSVERASEASAEDIIGVVSTKPGLLLGFDDTSLNLGEQGYPVGLKGRVPVKLSTENGPIKKGDRITISSISGIGMKATASSRVVGIALEDYDGTRAYSAGFLNQFGDDMVKERVTKKTIIDPKTQDGCYNGGGSALGEKGCTPDKVAKSAATLTQTSDNSEYKTTLAELQNEVPQHEMTPSGKDTTIGQSLMFIDLAWYQADSEKLMLSELVSTSTLLGGDGTETIWSRLKDLAQGFVNGVLTIAGIHTNELCVGSVCVDEGTFLKMVETAGTANTSSSNGGGSVNTTSNSTAGGNTTTPVTGSTTPSDVGTGGFGVTSVATSTTPEASVFTPTETAPVALPTPPETAPTPVPEVVPAPAV